MVKAGLTEAEIRTKHSEEVQELRRQLKKQEHVLESYKQSHGGLTVLMAEMRKAIEIYTPPRVEFRELKNKTTVENPCSAVFHITDVHFGAVQNPSEIEGFGEYSPEISARRCMQYIDRAIRWVKLHRVNYKIPKAVVLVTGDLISGDIHLELMVTNAFPVPMQVVGAAKLLADQISELSKHFENVEVHFIAEDNHARLTKKPQAKEAGINSFNYLVGEFAKQTLAHHKNVDFQIYTQYEKVIKVENRRYLCAHGHNIQGWMGIPFYGIERKVARESYKRMNASDDLKFHKFVIGHWHEPFKGVKIYVGGSVQGTDAYDHKAGRHADPSQSAWLVHPKHGEFDPNEFWLD
jgi:hypothetical protein